MKRLIVCAIAVSSLGMLLTAQSFGQVKQGKSRPLKTKHLMAGVVLPNCGALGKAVQAAAPADDKGWDALAQNAELLNEASEILMSDGRCPDATWAGATKSLREATEAMLKAIDAKNIDQAKTTFPEVTKACKACHTAHRK